MNWNKRPRELAAALGAVLVGGAILLASESNARAGFRALGKQPSPPSSASTGAWGTDPNIPNVVFDPVDGVCHSSLPYAKLYDRRPEEVKKYNDWISSKTKDKKFDLEMPELVTMPSGSSFAVWLRRGGPGRGARTARQSAWYPNGTDVSIPGNMVKWGEYMPKYHSGKEIVLEGGDYAAWHGFLPNNFGHILHENLPRVAYMRAMLPPSTKFLLPDQPTFRNLLGFIDPDFAKERAVWYQYNDVLRVEGGTMTILAPSLDTQTGSGHYNHLLIPYLRRWIAEVHPPALDVPRDERDRTILYATRRGGTQRRVVEMDHERDVLAVVQRYKEEYGFPGEIVVFNGHRPDGTVMPYEEQMAHFRRARYIIGPHGSALANVVWTNPTPASCGDRVKILEFIPGSDSAHVQHLYNGYYWVLGGLPMDWYQLTYAGNSTFGTTYIKLPELEDALTAMFGGREGAKGKRGVESIS